jgi:uncharacterized RDD family membrane protein YckC
MPPGYGPGPGYGAPPGYGVASGYGAPVLDPVLHQPLAPWWKRLVALLVDGAIVGLVYVIISAVIAASLSSQMNVNNQPSSGGRVFGAFVALWVVFSIPAAIYCATMNGSRRGQTLGKMVLGIAVRDARTGAPIGFWRGLSRFLITLVFEIALFVPFILDSLAPLWDRRRQAWHDKVVHSVVVDLKP